MTAATGNEQQRVDVLLAHARGMRAASTSKGITLSAKACGNLAADLEQVHAAVAGLIERERRMREALELLADGGRQPGHLTKTRVAEIARAALANVGGAK